MATSTRTGAASPLDRYFRISERRSTVRTEIIAGVATWLTMAYILFVNPLILGFIGVPGLEGKGLPFAQVLTVTALAAGVMTLAMGLFANYPFAIAAGLGLNAFVAFTLVVADRLSFPDAMGVIVAEGLLITLFATTVLATIINEWQHLRVWENGIAAVPHSVVATPDFGLVGNFSFGFVSTLGFWTALAVVVSVMLSDFFDTMGTGIGVG